MINVVLVDDHAVLRDGLKNIFALEEDIDVVGEAVKGEDALRTIRDAAPDVVIMDINLPGIDGLEVTRILKKEFPEIRILILTMYSDDDYLMAALREGSDGYMLKDSPSEQVVDAVRTVALGESIIHPSMTKKLIDYHNRKKEEKETRLTDREREVLICLVEGLSNKEIAEKLFISDKTVKIHVSKIYKKLDVKSRSQAVIHAVQHHLVPLPK